MMRLIKLAVISIAVLFIVATAIASLLPSVVIVSRAVNIHVPAAAVRAAVGDIRQWKRWIEGMSHPSVTIHSATSAKLGATTVTITRVTDTTVVSVWNNKKTKAQLSTIHIIASRVQDVTIVQWQFEQNLQWYPWEKFGSLMNDKILGTMMEKNLDNLKNHLEP